MREKTLKTNCLNAMNDPREAERWAFGGTNVPYRELFPDFYSKDTHIECQFRLGQLIKDRYQVICFSGARDCGWNNEMMWAHYADRQRGVCLEFEEEELIVALAEKYPEHRHFIQNVSYLKKQKESPWLDWNCLDDAEWNFRQIELNCYPGWFTTNHIFGKKRMKSGC